MKILNATRQNHIQLIEVWEASVRATHDFLPEAEIAKLKPLILNFYFDAVDLKYVKNKQDKILGFIGVKDGNIEMLFISPETRRTGVGRLLTRHAIENQGAKKVDVNEQNEQAVGFYKHLGFSVIGRSPLDGQGDPYPLLHMKLDENKPVDKFLEA